MVKKLGNTGIILFTAIYLIAYFAPQVNPTTSWPIALLGLAFPYLFLAGILFIIILVSSQLKAKWILLIALVPGFFKINEFYRFKSDPTPALTENQITVLTYNVRSFNRYKWIDDDGVFEDILRLVKVENPDVVFFQEFYASSEEQLKTIIQRINEVCNLPYYNSFDKSGGGKANGLYTFSKYPLQLSRQQRFSKNGVNGILESKLNWNNKPITLLNFHLASYQLSELNKQSQSKEEQFKGAFYKIRNGLKTRSTQVSQLITELKGDLDRTYIICGGDLNDTPHSYAYQQITDILYDSYTEAGSGEGKTYVGQLPGFRIDYLFHNEKLEALRYHTIREIKSDHYPVVVRFGVQQ
ncbi:endonuclease/exonuclease/phosphatase family protein [Luteibaculum oceani]|uniref:Endonuclease/exonuclease/phosphatase family protein n=1 Tax=Luteibaculum oceani TaxID=1294296 RepID=A0A5C6V2G5_9FLAO|nr:endonuclease/exonuclease/phosphatase family protein [Luteibaculum oceani]TXC78676.1 endonuclease/exonuclease/phosphatase family protein [Luteibaculum oceani]